MFGHDKERKRREAVKTVTVRYMKEQTDSSGITRRAKWNEDVEM